jgi:hypothetical protein
MAENNASLNRHNHLHPATFAAAAAIYKEMYGNDDGTIPATFQVIHLLGWKPDLSQARPARAARLGNSQPRRHLSRASYARHQANLISIGVGVVRESRRPSSVAQIYILHERTLHDDSIG